MFNLSKEIIQSWPTKLSTTSDS